MSQLRREAPAKITQRYQELLEKELEEDEKLMQAVEADGSPAAGLMDIPQLEREEAIVQDYQRSMEVLQRLKTVRLFF